MPLKLSDALGSMWPETRRAWERLLTEPDPFSNAKPMSTAEVREVMAKADALTRPSASEPPS
jgi:hypothetical protein